MATITRFAPVVSPADTVAGAQSVADSLSRGYPASLSYVGLAKTREFENTFSLAAITSGPAQRAATTVAVADVVKLFTIPANHVLLAARLEVLTAGTGAGTLGMSDGAALGSALAVNALGQASYATSKVYTTATDINLVGAGASISDGMYRVVVLTMDMTGQDTTTLITG